MINSIILDLLEGPEAPKTFEDFKKNEKAYWTALDIWTAEFPDDFDELLDDSVPAASLRRQMLNGYVDGLGREIDDSTLSIVYLAQIGERYAAVLKESADEILKAEFVLAQDFYKLHHADE